jgi:hypothetical protein
MLAAALYQRATIGCMLQVNIKCAKFTAVDASALTLCC